MNLALEQYRAELEDLCRRYHVRRLELFGSAVREHSNAGPNDLDFLVEFQPLPEGRYADAFFGFMESLENLFQKPVDLIVPSAIKNPYFRQSVEATKKLLYVG